MADELTSQEQIEDDGEAHAARLQRQRAGDTFMDRLLEIFNPFEALEIAFEDPRAGLVFLLGITGLFAIVFIAGIFLSAALELFFGGGPPQGLGLK